MVRQVACKRVSPTFIAQRVLHRAADADNGAARTGQNEAPRAALAQLVEHIIRNDGVTCSSHVSGTSTPSQMVSKR